MIPDQLFTDGGLIGPNPSPKGGTWAWCWVREGQIIRYGAGIVEPADLGMEVVTNNQTEAFAALMGLESLPEGWRGDWWCDSQITVYRFCGSDRFNGLPEWIIKRIKAVRLTRHYKATLCAGHPTRKELREGVRIRNGLPVSKFNVFCDQECTKSAKEYQQ